MDSRDIAICSKALAISIAINFVFAGIVVVAIVTAMLREPEYRSATSRMRIETMEPSRETPHDPASLHRAVILEGEDGVVQPKKR